MFPFSSVLTSLKSFLLIEIETDFWLQGDLILINTLLCPIIFNSHTIELTEHTYCNCLELTLYFFKIYEDLFSPRILQL